METKNPKKHVIQLLLDASTPFIQVGILQNGQWLAFEKDSEEALESIFKNTEKCFKTCGLKLDDIDQIIYCQGPGSLLGIRITCMAIRTWLSLYSENKFDVLTYENLNVSLRILKENKNGSIIAYSRKGYFFIKESIKSKIKEITSEELLKIKKTGYALPSNKGVEFPKEYLIFEYDLEKHPEVFNDNNILKVVDKIDALQLREQKFVKWQT